MRGTWFARAAARGVVIGAVGMGWLAGAAALAEAPVTQPATAPATVAAKRAALSLDIDAVGTFTPVDAVEIRLKPDAYKGEWKIVSAAAPGTAVKKGDKLIEFDPTDLKRELESAENDLLTATANATKAGADAKLGEEGDALALAMQKNALETAESNLKWFNDLLGPQMLQSADMRLKQSQAYVEDQQDELDQLKKMYKSEDLTASSADIVIKRAIRSLDLSKQGLDMTTGQVRKTKETDHEQAKKTAEYALEQAKQTSAQLAVTQAQAKVVRQTSMKAAQLALVAAQKRVNDLKSDLEKLNVAAPQDGVVLLGGLANGAWAGNDARAFAAGEKLTPNPAPAMTLYTPGKLKIVFDVPESKLGWVTQGMEASIKPVAFPQHACKGQLSAVPLVGKAGAEQLFEMTIDCPGIEDERIRPGMKANVHLSAKSEGEVLTLPTAAVSNGKVRVKDGDGKEQEKDVVTGRTDGKLIEILSGVNEGDEVLTGPKS